VLLISSSRACIGFVRSFDSSVTVLGSLNVPSMCF
jgi:hypothetical protein